MPAHTPPPERMSRTRSPTRFVAQKAKSLLPKRDTRTDNPRVVWAGGFWVTERNGSIHAIRCVAVSRHARYAPPRDDTSTSERQYHGLCVRSRDERGTGQQHPNTRRRAGAD